MTYNTYRSRLIPYEKEIIALRRQKPPMPYEQIAALLMEKYNLSIKAPAIFKFVKVRSKGYKPCTYAWDVELPSADNKRTTEMLSLRKTQSLQPPKSSIPKPTKTIAEATADDDFDMPFSETYNLTRMPPEEAAARLKKLKERNQQ